MSRNRSVGPCGWDCNLDLADVKTMGNEGGTWIMYGVAPEDPKCIHTVAEHWWSENPDIDPWEWRAIIAGSDEVLWDDGKASKRQKKIMNLFAEENMWANRGENEMQVFIRRTGR